VATVGLNTGVVRENAFAAVVIMVLVTTLVTPILLRALYPVPAEPE
jgi:Kef-type K+ transport system membrane component KefB